ncbi:flagellin [Anaerobiospirillum sp. NML120448]|uniref:flagellin N-terminal helical domain-containing protein n=1 Tax=Anaerobiospirillum sp. NML120448 TaxID=2932816 RepID=UPI001FF673F5|nr:flagellin [Anaerobiospirillum sp. NML120448]MCK0515118.1 flagellin [Anaerobiospirillum sp. NML120448]
MAVYVNTNVSSLNGRRYLNNVQNQLTTTYQRLSSGMRINSAKDDAAGLQIADRLTTQINGLNQGNRNSNDAIALAQTMEGALDETTNMLQKIRTLAVQAANGTNTKADYDALQQEVTSLSAEMGRIAEQTKFGGQTVLNGKLDANTNPNSLIGADGKVVFQVGANKGDEIELNIGEHAFTLTGLANMAGLAGKDDVADAIGADGTGIVNGKAAGNNQAKVYARWTVSSAQAAKKTLENIDKIIAQVDSKRSDLGALQNRLESSIRNQSNVSANQADARSRIRDADFAEESAALSQQSIIQQAATSMLMQANSRPQLALSMLG